MGPSLEPSRYRTWTRVCADALAESRHDIDAINVFPIADGDTGTNAWLTFDSAATAVESLPEDAGIAELLRTHARSLLLAARGNSGVILSELARGCLSVLSSSPELSGQVVAESLAAGSKAAWAAVAHPQAGTILSVADAAAAAAAESAESGAVPFEVFRAAASAAQEALERTPDQMELLARNGVVDAGGRALVVVLSSVVGETAPASVVKPAKVPEEPSVADLSPEGPAYEVMFLLERSTDEAVDVLRAELDRLGDSLVVVGGEGLWNVHVHTDDVGGAIEAGIGAGRPFHIRVTHFAEQRARAGERRGGRVVVSAVFGSSMAELVRASGAVPLEFTHEAPLSATDLGGALTELAAEEIIVLPNREGHLKVAELAAAIAREHGSRVAVIPTTVQVQGLAALSVHDPGAPFDVDVVAMSTAAHQVRHGALTIASSDGLTTAGPCRAGDVLGVVDGDFAIVGDDLAQVCHEVLEQLGLESAELVTLVTGADCPASIPAAIVGRLEREYPLLDFAVHDGGQEKYPLFVSVE